MVVSRAQRSCQAAILKFTAILKFAETISKYVEISVAEETTERVSEGKQKGGKVAFILVSILANFS